MTAAAAASLAVALAVLGSWVRINGAGMTCPDWPLCRGALVPQLIGGVVLEWTHRAIALTVGFVIVAAFVAGWRVRRDVAGTVPTLFALVAIFLLQVIVGGITIHESNSPRSVALHWGVAMALLAVLVFLALLAFIAPRPGSGLPAVRPGAPVAVLGFAAVLAYVTMCIGSYVSSSGAGLACATFPACDVTGAGLGPPQLVQMAHRFAAGAVRPRRPRRGGDRGAQPDDARARLGDRRRGSRARAGRAGNRQRAVAHADAAAGGARSECRCDVYRTGRCDNARNAGSALRSRASGWHRTLYRPGGMILRFRGV